MDAVLAGALAVIWKRGIHRQPGDLPSRPPKSNEGLNVIERGKHGV